MNVGIGTEGAQFLFWEYLFRIFGIVSLQCNYEHKVLYTVTWACPPCPLCRPGCPRICSGPPPPRHTPTGARTYVVNGTVKPTAAYFNEIVKRSFISLLFLDLKLFGQKRIRPFWQQKSLLEILYLEKKLTVNPQYCSTATSVDQHSESRVRSGRSEPFWISWSEFKGFSRLQVPTLSGQSLTHFRRISRTVRPGFSVILM